MACKQFNDPKRSGDDLVVADRTHVIHNDSTTDKGFGKLVARYSIGLRTVKELFPNERDLERIAALRTGEAYQTRVP
jgi:hypothetical protein